MNADNLRCRLAAVRCKQLNCIVGTGLSLVLIAVVSLLSLGMIIDWLGELPWLGRAVLLAGNLAGIGYITWRQVVLPVRAAPDEDGYALLVEQNVPEFQTRLIASVQLTRAGALPDSESPAMVRELVAQTEALAKLVNFNRVVSAQQTGICVLVAILIMGAATLAFVVGQPAAGALLQRAFLLNVPMPHKTKTMVLTGNQKIAQGDPLVIEARATGVVPPRGKLTLQYVSGRKQEFPMLPTPGAQFSQTLDNVPEAFTYAVQLNDDTSETFTVQVIQRPVVTGIECQQVYPAYTRLGTVKRAVTDLTLLAGSRLELNLTVNKPIATASLRLAGLNADAPLRVSPLDRRRLTGAINIPQSGLTGLTVQLLDEDGLHAKELALYRIDVVPDLAPTIGITDPERKEELVTSGATVVIKLEAHDDFGVAKVLFHYKSPAIKAGQEQVVDLDLGGETPHSLRRQHEWKLVDLLPDDTAIEYWFEARDANNVTGPGIGQTEHDWLKIVSEEDKRTDLWKASAAQLSVLADRQDANLSRAIATANRPVSEPAAFAGQVSEQEAIGSEIDHVSPGLLSFAKFRPGQISTESLLAAQAGALANLKNSQATAAAGHEKVIRDELRGLARVLTQATADAGGAAIEESRRAPSLGQPISISGQSASVGLPERERRTIQESQGEKYPAEYGLMIEQYFRNLAEVPVRSQRRYSTNE